MRRPGKRVSLRWPVLPVFAERWSPRSFADRPVEEEKLCSVFEAARLAPSAHNNQPARFLVARRDHGEGWKRLLACLSAANQTWACSAPVLVLASATRQRFSQSEARLVAYPHFMHDLGLAVMSAIVQAHALGLSCHPMAGFDPEQARESFAIPGLFEPGVVIAIGYLGPADALPGELRARELAPRTRRELTELVFEDSWGRASPLFFG